MPNQNLSEGLHLFDIDFQFAMTQLADDSLRKGAEVFKESSSEIGALFATLYGHN